MYVRGWLQTISDFSGRVLGALNTTTTITCITTRLQMARTMLPPLSSESRESLLWKGRYQQLVGEEMLLRTSLITTANAPRRLHTQTIIFSTDS